MTVNVRRQFGVEIARRDQSLAPHKRPGANDGSSASALEPSALRMSRCAPTARRRAVRRRVWRRRTRFATRCWRAPARHPHRPRLLIALEPLDRKLRKSRDLERLAGSHAARRRPSRAFAAAAPRPGGRPRLRTATRQPDLPRPRPPAADLRDHQPAARRWPDHGGDRAGGQLCTRGQARRLVDADLTTPAWPAGGRAPPPAWPRCSPATTSTQRFVAPRASKES